MNRALSREHSWALSWLLATPWIGFLVVKPPAKGRGDFAP